MFHILKTRLTSTSFSQRVLSNFKTVWWVAKFDWISWQGSVQKDVSHNSKLFDDHNELKNVIKTLICHILNLKQTLATKRYLAEI